MTRKSDKHLRVTYGSVDINFNVIRSYQQRISLYFPMDIEPLTSECRAENLPLSYWSTSDASDPKLTSHDNCTPN